MSWREPAGVEVDAGALAVEDLEHLRLVGPGVGLHLLGRERRARGVAPGGVADHAGEIADEEDHLVAELLELAHLVEQHRVPEVQIRRGRVEARLDAQRHAAQQLLREVGAREHLVRATFELCDLLLEIHRHSREAR